MRVVHDSHFTTRFRTDLDAPLPRRGQRGPLPLEALVGSWLIDNGTGLYSTGGGFDRATVNTGSPAGIVEAHLSVMSGDNAGICWRADGTSFLRLVTDGGSTYLQWVSGSSFTAIQTFGGGGSGSVFRAEFFGTRLRVFRDGVLLADRTESRNVGATRHGIHHRNGSGHKTSRLRVWAPDTVARRHLAADHRGREARLRIP